MPVVIQFLILILAGQLELIYIRKHSLIITGAPVGSSAILSHIVKNEPFFFNVILGDLVQLNNLQIHLTKNKDQLKVEMQMMQLF